ncbi:MAG: sigma-70 family RNA polymerase sigma factor, partial [Actinomycetota bacterium]
MVDLETHATEDAPPDLDLIEEPDAPPATEPEYLERPADLDALGAYLKGIGRFSLIDAAREVELAKAIEEGQLAHERLKATPRAKIKNRRKDERLRREGEAARTEMIQANLRLVVAMARKYRWTGVPLLDLIQEGNLGLMRGVGKFDWRKGFKFSTYATWWIRQSIQRGIADRGRVIRLPVHIHELMLRVGRARGQLKAELGREPSDREVAR